MSIQAHTTHDLFWGTFQSELVPLLKAGQWLVLRQSPAQASEGVDFLSMTRLQDMPSGFSLAQDFWPHAELLFLPGSRWREWAFQEQAQAQADRLFLASLDLAPAREGKRARF